MSRRQNRAQPCLPAIQASRLVSTRIFQVSQPLKEKLELPELASRRYLQHQVLSKQQKERQTNL